MTERKLHEFFFQSLNLHQNKIAVIEDTGIERNSLSYQELWKTSSVVSETLATISDNQSEGSGDQGCHQFVAVCMEQCLVYPAVILGILNQSFAFATIDPMWSLERQHSYLKELGVSLLIHTNRERSCNPNDQLCSVNVQDTSLYFLRFHSHIGIRSSCPHPMAFAVLTSGSTGIPKVVRVPHSSIVPNIVDIVKICNITSRDIIFLSAPSTFDPSVVDIFVAFYSGASLLITSKTVKLSPNRLLHVLFPKEKSKAVTVLQMTPSIFNRWSEKDLQDVVLGSQSPLKVLILGGEPFPSISKLKQCQGIGNQTQIFNIYGITEVSSWATIYKVQLSANGTHNDQFCCYENPTPIGRPLSDTCIEVRDCDSGVVIKSGLGEMFIGSSKRICEVDNEQCVEYCFPVFRSTGDFVQLHTDGTINYVGRKDNLIKRWGHRICLEKIEYIALSHASVKSACCVWNEQTHKLFLIVALREDFPTFALRRHILNSVGSETALLPDQILQVEDVSLTFHGKVNRLKVVEELLQNRICPLLKFNISEIFLGVWCEVLGLQSLENPEASFISCGGNSLLAVMLMTEIEQKFGQVSEDFAIVLLSGKSFQDICDSLCQFHQQIAGTADVIDKSSTLQVARFKSEEKKGLLNENVKRQKQEKDKLLSFSLRGTSSCGTASFAIAKNNLLQDVNIKLLWKINLEKCIDASPLCLIYESNTVNIVIGSHSGKFTMVDGCTGQTKWLLNLPDRIESSACTSVCGQFVYVGCYDGTLYCITSFDGKVKWTFKTGGMIKCCPVTCNEGKSVLFGSYDFQVYCVCAESGTLLWSSFVFGDEVKKGSWLASPLIVQDVAILCSLACKAAAVQTSNGTLTWSASFESPIFSTPCQLSVPSGTLVVIAEVKGIIHCFHALTGNQIWKWEVTGHIFAPLTTTFRITPDGDSSFLIFVACYDCCLYCLAFNCEKGIELKWKKDMEATIGSAPFPFTISTFSGLEKCCVITANSAGTVFLIDSEDGRIWSRYNVHSEVFSSSVIFEDKVWFGCRDDNLYCLRLQY